MSSRGANGSNFDVISPEELRKFQASMLESNVEIDDEALNVIVNLLRLNVSPDEIYSVLKQISPLCGLLKRFKLKTPKSSAEDR